MTEERRGSANIERHIQTIMVSLATGGIMFSAGFFFKDVGEKAATRAQLEALVVQVNELRTDVKELRSSFVRRDEFMDHESRIRQLEQRK